MSSTAPQRRTALPRNARAAVDRARLTVVPRLRSRAPRVPFVTLVSLVLLAGVVSLLLFNTSMQQASFTESRLNDQARALSAKQEALAMELAQLREPQRLAQQACELGMVVGPTAAFLDIASGELTGKPVPAVAGPCGFEPVARPAPPVPEDVPVLPGTSTGTSTSTSTSTSTGAPTGTASGAAQARPAGSGR
jgi:outer membrane murein-binding lipoprotein Lpp